jgi:hypothetical protein
LPNVLSHTDGSHAGKEELHIFSFVFGEIWSIDFIISVILRKTEISFTDAASHWEIGNVEISFFHEMWVIGLWTIYLNSDLFHACSTLLWISAEGGLFCYKTMKNYIAQNIHNSSRTKIRDPVGAKTEAKLFIIVL